MFTLEGLSSEEVKENGREMGIHGAFKEVVGEQEMTRWRHFLSKYKNPNSSDMW